jgi:hypothetical protein
MARPKLTDEERRERQRASYKSYYQRNRDALIAQMRQNRGYYKQDSAAKKKHRNCKRLQDLKEQTHSSLIPLVDAILHSPYLPILTNNELVVIESVICLIPKEEGIPKTCTEDIVTDIIV